MSSSRPKSRPVRALPHDLLENVIGPPAPRSNACPIRKTWALLASEWSVAVLRDIGLYHRCHFNEVVRSNPGLTARVLSRRLRELTEVGLIRRTIYMQDPFRMEWHLTPKGEDRLPVLAALARFGVRHFGYAVFDDARPRELRETFPLLQAALESVADSNQGSGASR